MLNFMFIKLNTMALIYTLYTVYYDFWGGMIVN